VLDTYVLDTRKRRSATAADLDNFLLAACGSDCVAADRSTEPRIDQRAWVGSEKNILARHL
jgi:hypothetical protein